ncbi:PAS domain-containing protein [Vitiosangium sp. GDMCC 1.1324]|uniref:PAS domain-containing sensor histidine kinase n=1 Tax=Vitiosangium sp. (strain GDMCC 1.1324) TaxID=2138576 RepID=UPI000D335CB4|nr:PAS domain-containing protein [Vitiosangium sp. GDMCC 1.1324]PTL82171.1 hypothetical protein DAT35_20480 [Vitiosangium sp. GDMCC 1.1324]
MAHGMPPPVVCRAGADVTFKHPDEQGGAVRKDLATAQLDVLWDAPIGIVYLDRDLRYVRVNAALAEMNGASAEAHLGKTVAEVLPPGEATESIIQNLLTVLTTGKPLNFELEWIASGTPPQRRFSRVGYYPVFDGVEVVGLCGYVEDTTAQKLADEARRASEAWLSRLFDSGLIGILVWNRNGSVLDANSRFLDMVGYTQEDLKAGNLHWPAVMPHPEAESPAPSAEELLALHAPSEKELVHKDGTRVPVLQIGAFFEGSKTEGVSFFLDSGELRRAQESVRQSESRLRGVMAALSEGIIFQDTSGTIGFANAAASRLLDLTNEQLLGRSPHDPRWHMVREDGTRYPGEEHPAMLAVRTGVPQLDKVMGIHHADGTVTWLSINAFPLTSPDGGTPIGAVASFFDVTRRKAAEEALRMSEDRLRMAIASASLGTWDYNPVTGSLQWDERCKELFGLPPQAPADYDVFLSALPAEDRERTHQVVQRTLQPENGGNFHLDYRILRLDDHVERWISSRGRAYFDDKGQAYRFVGTVLDITQRKRDEANARFLLEASRILAEHLKSTEEMLQRLARLAASTLCSYGTMCLVQEDGSVRRVASAHRDPAKEDLLRESGRFLANRTASKSKLEAVLNGKPCLIKDFTPELRERLANSPEHLDVINAMNASSIMVVPLQARGKMLGLMSLAVVAPQRRFDEEDLAFAQELAHRVAVSLENIRLYQEAQQAVGLRDEFLSVASHELKTPLTSLKLQHELLGRMLSQERRVDIGPRLSAALRQVNRLSSLVDSLLDVSRISAGTLKLEPIDVDLTQLTREALDRIRDVVDQAGCAVDFPSVAPVRGDWDPLRLDQVLVNLLANAAKYGAGKPIHIRVEAREKQALLTIRDEGIGIAAKDLPRLFSRFGRAVSERHYGGLGLGLYISRQIIEAMGGRIRVESQPEQGATFTVELPLCTPGQQAR